MKCIKPFVAGGAAFGCGQCMPCRFNRRRIWAHRLMLEAKCHDRKSFATLTYEKEPEGSSVNVKHVQDWLKRLRKKLQPEKIRYFVVGEYGETTWRPHYHAALFGVGCDTGPVLGGTCQCRGCSVVRETWGFGHTMLGNLELKSAQYLCGYVTKKMTHREDPRLLGRAPEFARMSLVPGIGANAMWDVSSEIMRYRLDEKLVDVPNGLRHGKTVLPLGRYLRQQLRRQIGREKQSRAVVEAKELPVVRAFAWANQRSVASVYEEVNEGVEAKCLAKLNIYRSSHEAI